MQPFLLGAVRILAAVQATQATIAGTVRDGHTDAPIAGAIVALPDLDRSTATDAGGRYVLDAIPAGPQHVAVRFIGYAPRTLHALVPREGELRLNISLRPEPLRLPTVVVRPPIAMRGIDAGDSTAYPDRGSSIAAVWNHPLLAEPDVFQALGGGEVVLKPESPSGVHLRGGAADQTAYLLDGVPVISPYHAAGMFSAWNPDALAAVRVSSTGPAPEYPQALSGSVSGVTRTPGSRLRAQGGVSSTQTRLTVDGPLGAAGGGYLVSFRSGFPGSIAPEGEASYLRGETGDLLAKLELPVFGGRVRLLGYDSDNELDAAASAVVDGSSADPRRNAFEWRSRSVGMAWRRPAAGGSLRVVGWSATGDAGAVWAGQVAAVSLASGRRDLGVLAALEHDATTIGLRAERSTTSYAIACDAGAGESWAVTTRTPTGLVFARHTARLGRAADLTAGASLAALRGDLYLAPHAELRWRPSDGLTLSGSYARRHQYAQSLRNPESVVGSIFPADLYLGIGAAGVPTARSDQGVIAADWRPVAGMRVGVQAYARELGGLVLVAPREGEPFATADFGVGSGTARGISLDAAWTAARLGVVASYGFQQVTLADGATRYAPDHAATHLFDAGAIVFPTATTSLRLGVAGGLGRRTTTVSGGFEWEACNLLDRGCEFGGSPHYAGQPIGATELPGYLRVDLGVRKHWHVQAGGRDAVVALFATVTNLFGRRNLLTRARDPSTGELADIEMRPLAPLVVGLDWRF